MSRANWCLSATEPPQRDSANLKGRLRWYAGQSILRQHTFTTAVEGATACCFESQAGGGVISGLAVLEANAVTIYAQDGAVHSVALARKPRALWPLRRGVIVEPDRSAAASASFASEASASGMIDSHAASASEPAPFLMLERPLDEPQEIDDSAVPGALGCTIILSDATRSRLLAHDPVRKCHVMWAVEPAWRRRRPTRCRRPRRAAQRRA